MLRGGVIGFGRMGLTHYSILNNHPDVNFVAASDPSSFMRKNINKYLGLESFEDSDKMIGNMDLDFVIIATPTAHHFDAIKHSIENDVHMFVEKPFTLNPEQGREVIGILDDKRLVNQVGYVVRFSDVFMRIKELLKNNTIGELLSFRMEMHGPTLLKRSKSSWRTKRKQGGGCLFDFASHSVDLINSLIGPPKQVTGSVLKSIFSQDVEDAVYSTFLYSDSLSGLLIANWSDASYRKPTYRLELFGRGGKIIADLHEFKLYLNQEPDNGEFSKGWNTRYVTDFAEPVRFYVRGGEFTRQLDYFIDCVKAERPGTVCNFEDGISTDLIMHKIVNNYYAQGNLNG